MFQGGVSGEDRVVRLHNSRGDLWGGVDGVFQLRLLAVVDAQPFHEQGSETRSSSAAEAVEDEESLQTCAQVGQFSNAVKDEIDDFLSDGVVASGVIVGCVLLSADQLLRMEELSVGPSSNLV